MAYVICEPCVDVMDTACVDVCPVDCIHTIEGEKQLYINPDECIDCAACEPVCPVTAIFMIDDVPEQWISYNELNAKFFETFVKPGAAEGAAEAGGKAEGQVDKKFRASDVEEFVQLLEPPKSSIRAPLRPFVILFQPLLGAFSAKFKSELEEMASNSTVFSAAISTAINSLINLALYPLVLFLVATRVWGIDFFTGRGNFFILLGVALAIGEGLYRFKDELVATTTDEESRYGASLYGWILSFIANPLLSALRSVIVTEPDAPRLTLPGAALADGHIYAEDTRERYRRYGMLHRFNEQADRYIIEIEFPRWVPDCEYKKEYNLPDLMPDYTYEISLDGNTLIVEAGLEDPRFAEILGRASSFPNGFRNVFHIEGKPESYRDTYRDKLLEIVVPKSGKAEDLPIERKVHYAKLRG
jgi:NAD-dependent dihydropyrimidine dehydrogenase PreA subunit